MAILFKYIIINIIIIIIIHCFIFVFQKTLNKFSVDKNPWFCNL